MGFLGRGSSVGPGPMLVMVLLSVNIAAVNRLLLLVCLTGTRSVSISLTKRAKDSSPLLTSSEFYR